MSRTGSIAQLHAVIEFINAHPPGLPRVGEMSFGVFRSEKDSREQSKRIRAALHAVGFPDADDGPREIWHASKLTPEQRAVADLLARHPEVPAGWLPIPSSAWAKRKWLGIDPPGPLFSGKPSLFQKLMAIDPHEEDDWLPLLKPLSRADRIIALTELTLARGDFDTVATHNALVDEVATIPKTLAPWAEQTAGMLLTFAGTPAESMEASPWGIEALVIEVVFLALIRAKRPIDAKLDRLLMLENYAWESAVPRMREIVEAIPTERRERAVGEALERLKGPAHRLAIAMRMVETFPYPSLVRFALANIDDGKPRKVMQVLTALGKKHAAIAEALHAHKSSQPAPPKLTVLERSTPTIDALDEIAKKQVLACAKLYDGRALSVLKLIEGDEDEPIAPFERTRIGDANEKLAYDAWCYAGDSGTVFRANTTVVIAEIIQSSLECSDAALRTALVDALASKPKAKAKTANANAKPKTKTKESASKNKASIKRTGSTGPSVLAIVSDRR